jgi:hypothetical protein
MNELTIHIPSSLQRSLTDLAREDSISVDQFVSSAIAEKISALLTVKYLKERADRGSRAHLRKLLDAVPNVEPEEKDRM